MEAQLQNITETIMTLQNVILESEPVFDAVDLNLRSDDVADDPVEVRPMKTT